MNHTYLVGEMDAIPTDSHVDTINRIEICIRMNVTAPKLQHEEVWEGNAKSVKHLRTAQVQAAKTILECSCTTSNTVLKAELEMRPHR